MVGALEDLSLLGDGMDDGLQGRAAIGDTEAARLDLLDHLADAPADRPEILQPFIPQEPGLVGRRGVFTPLRDEVSMSVRHAIPQFLDLSIPA
ncbi:hypothetical protein [Brevundimonas vesicularis]|uniref:hypothetical protein n=1 Tax=Brevundimonas vesicularis TaxID=41276 RepID=UPI0020C62B65|nr:hypothetical protein [Brevundimonas vesicularis]